MWRDQLHVDVSQKSSQDEAGNGQYCLQLKERSGTVNVFAGGVMPESGLKLGCNLTGSPVGKDAKNANKDGTLTQPVVVLGFFNELSVFPLHHQSIIKQWQL